MRPVENMKLGINNKADTDQDRKLRVELTLKAAELRKAALQMDEQSKQLQQAFALAGEKDRAHNEMEGHVRTLTDQVKLLEQSRDNHAALPSLLTRHHDQARREIQSLKMQIKAHDTQLTQLRL